MDDGARRTLVRRGIFLGASAFFAGAGFVGAACATPNEPLADAEDAPQDVTRTDVMVDVRQVDAEDSAPPEPTRDGGHCSPVQGLTCDLVLQDCDDGFECVVVGGDASRTTACVAGGTGNRPIGAKCCPGEEDQCVAGLRCSGTTACTPDSGPTGRCTPYCCPGDDSVCGVSSPEGYSGICDVRIVSSAAEGNRPLYDVCSYRPTCRPFQLLPCPEEGQTCLLQRDKVSFRCSNILNPPGRPAGAPCSFANECRDGLACLVSGDAGTCRPLCHRANAGLDGGDPFQDASALQDAAGLGGCDDGTACTGTVSTFPPYLGVCL